MQTQTLARSMESKEPTQNQMKCLVKEDLNVDGLSFRTDTPKPPLGFDDVRIRVLATSVCGTDKNIYRSGTNEGIRREMQRYITNNEGYKPIVVGHEFCGIVDEVGPGVAPDRWTNRADDYLSG